MSSSVCITQSWFNSETSLITLHNWLLICLRFAFICYISISFIKINSVIAVSYLLLIKHWLILHYRLIFLLEFIQFITLMIFNSIIILFHIIKYPISYFISLIKCLKLLRLICIQWSFIEPMVPVIWFPSLSSAIRLFVTIKSVSKILNILLLGWWCNWGITKWYMGSLHLRRRFQIFWGLPNSLKLAKFVHSKFLHYYLNLFLMILFLYFEIQIW